LLGQRKTLRGDGQLIYGHVKSDQQPNTDNGRQGHGGAALQSRRYFQKPDLAIGPHEKFTVNKPSSHPVFPTG
jgi:hypothetical protein